MVESHRVRQEFQGHKAMKARVFRLVQYTHASASQLVANPVARNGWTEQPGRLRHLRALWIRTCEALQITAVDEGPLTIPETVCSNA